MPLPFIIGAIAAGAAVAGVASTRKKVIPVAVADATTKTRTMTTEVRIQYLDEKIPEFRKLAELFKFLKEKIFEAFDSNPSLFVSKNVASELDLHVWLHDDESVEEWRSKLEEACQELDFGHEPAKMICEEYESDDDFRKSIDEIAQSQETKKELADMYDAAYKMVEECLSKLKELYSY